MADDKVSPGGGSLVQREREKFCARFYCLGATKLLNKFYDPQQMQNHLNFGIKLFEK
jgi:hypothetical protein